MKLASNLIICIALISLCAILGYYIYNSYNNYTPVTMENFTGLLEKNAINSVEINRDRIIVVTEVKEKNITKLIYNTLPISEKDKIVKLLKEKNKEKLINYPGVSYFFIIPYLILFLILAVIIIASRRGNINATLFKEKKFKTTSSLMKARTETITWTNLISGEPFKITTAYGDLSSSEQDQYLLLLIEAILSEDLEIKRNASFALREIGDRRSLIPLCNMLEGEEDPNIKTNIALALGLIREEKALTVLKKAIKDENPLVRCAIATAIGGIESEESLGLLKNILKNDDNWRVKRSVIMALMKFREEEAFSAITLTAEDREPAVRASVAIALGEMGLEEGIPVLEKILFEDGEPPVRKEAILALQEIGGEDIIKPLCRALSEDENKTVRKSALSAVELIDNEMITETLCTVLKKDKDPDIRLASAEALAIRKSPKVIETFRIALQDNDEMVRSFIKEELNKIQ